MKQAMYYTGMERPKLVKTKYNRHVRRQSPHFAGPFKDTGFTNIFEDADHRIVQRVYEAPDGWTMYEEYITHTSHPTWENFTVFYAVRNRSVVRGDTLAGLIAQWQLFVSRMGTVLA